MVAREIPAVSGPEACRCLMKNLEEAGVLDGADLLCFLYDERDPKSMSYVEEAYDALENKVNIQSNGHSPHACTHFDASSYGKAYPHVWLRSKFDGHLQGKA